METDQIYEDGDPEIEQTDSKEINSILTSVKKLLGITEEYEHFDVDLILHINTTLGILTQIGVGPEDGFSIHDKSAVWDDFLQGNTRLELVKSYVHHKVRLLFDPPLSSAVIEAMNRMLGELEWRIYVTAEEKVQNETIAEKKATT